MNRSYARALFGVGILMAFAAPIARLHAQERVAPGSVADTTRIRGIVVDAGTRAPLAATQVQIVELGRGELTHEDGAFHFTKIPAGMYTLIFERIGYRRETRRVAIAAGDSADLRIALEFSAIQMPGLVVTGTVAPRLGDQAVRATTVVTGQELGRKLDGTIAGTLRNEPGIAAVSTGPATARPVIRGLGGDRILLLEDGGRVGDLSSSSPDHAVSIDPVTARQIEVVRGPATLLYGSNALGGVVNVIREEIPTSLADRLHGSVSVQGQTMNRGATGGGFVTGTAGPIALRVEGSGRRAGEVSTPDGELENTGVESYNVSAGASWVSGWGHAGAAYRAYSNSYGVPGFPGGHEDGVDIEMRRHTLRGETRIRSGRGSFSSLHLAATYSDYYHRELEPGGILGTEFGQLSGTGELVARHTALGPFIEGAIGMQGQWRDYAAGGSISITPTDEYGLAGFILEEVELARLRLQFGGRYDWRRVVPTEESVEEIGHIRTRNFGSVSGSLGALYELGSGVGIGGSIARAFRTPDANELFSRGPHLAVYLYEVGNPDLEPETGVGADVFLRVSREFLQGELAAFQNRIAGYIYSRTTGGFSPTGLPIYQHVGEDAEFTGFEGRMQWTPIRRLVLDGTVSYVRGTLTTTDEPLPLIPPLNGMLSVRYERPRYFLGLGWKGAARQNRPGRLESSTEGHKVFDATAGYRWTAFGSIHALTLRADNLSDSAYRDHLSRVKDLMPQPGRSLTLLYRVTF